MSLDKFNSEYPVAKKDFKNKKLFEGLNRSPKVQYISGHSLSMTEELLQLQKNGDEYQLIYREYPKEIDPKYLVSFESFKLLESKSYLKTIDKELSTAIHTLFLSAIKHGDLISESQEESFELGLDGETFYFGVNSKGIMRYGVKWSPPEDTKIFRLIKVCSKLIKFVCDNIALDSTILISEIAQLNDDFEKSWKKYYSGVKK